MEVARALRIQNLDPWWFPHVLNPEQVDPMVDCALSNCNRCIFVWTMPTPSNWTFCELMSIRNHFCRRLPSGEATEAFIIVRDLTKVAHNARLPLFSECQYVDYEPGKGLDFKYLDDSVPGVKPLVAGGKIRPRLSLDRRCKYHIGRRVLHGTIDHEAELPFKKRFCWVFLEDKKRNRYIQQPRPTFTHACRWGSAVINLGENIQSILLAAVDEIAHAHVVTRALKQSYSGEPIAKWPGNYYELDRIEFSPLQESDCRAAIKGSKAGIKVSVFP